jgi:hypothetical protein
LDDLPVHLTNDDSIPQDEISNGVLQEIFRSSAESDSYDGREPKDLSLSHLRALYERGLHTNVIQYMRNFKARIVLSPEDYYDHRDPHIAWKAGSSHKLDYICAVGNKLGIHAALTNVEINVNYVFELLPKPQKHFNGKYAQLGFDQASSLLHIGSRPGEEVFICMAPSETLMPSFESPPPPGFCTGPTTLNPKHARILMIFISYCLSHMADITSVYCMHPYDIPMPPEPINWDLTTNAL